jgi:hypothetical protein
MAPLAVCSGPAGDFHQERGLLLGKPIEDFWVQHGSQIVHVRNKQVANASGKAVVEKS